MNAARLVDILIVVMSLGYFIEGWRNGLVRSVASIIGLIAGAVAAFFAIPLVAALVPNPIWRLVVVFASVVMLIRVGALLGNAVGRAAARPGGPRVLRPVGRAGGGLANVVVGGLITAMIAGSVASLGIPVLTRAVADSWVLQAINAATPAPVTAALARLRSAVVAQGMPVISVSLGAITPSPGAPPHVATNTAALKAAAASVVKISGTAYACGQNLSGSGFVVAKDRIVTNAHVIAGVKQPVISARNGQTLDGRVVYFDSQNDLAVIAVTGLHEPTLTLGPAMSQGSTGVVDGYPFGGPFTSGGAKVLAEGDQSVDNIYGTKATYRELYTLAAHVEPGNSGGPLLEGDGSIGGIVFARATNEPNVGYAMTDALLSPVVKRAPSMTTAVNSGKCVRG